MRLRAGTSGWNYDGWAGFFYPDDLKKDDRLRYYSERLGAVEINNTFYRIPKTEVVQNWAAQVPDGFTFVLKCSRRITHFTRLKESGDEPMSYMWRAASSLASHRGPILFQLPPNFRKDVPLLRSFLERLPDECRAVFEFRHETWLDEEVHTTLGDAGAALCYADTSADGEPRLEPTASWGYLRLRRDEYTEAELDAWVERVRAQPWGEVFVFFKHEDGGAAPRLATDFSRRFGS